MSLREYRATCPNCRKEVSRKTPLGTDDYPYEVKRMDFECPHCHMRFIVSIPTDEPPIQAAWESGD